MSIIQNVEKEIDQYLYFGSNEWLLQFRAHLDQLIEERKSYTHELFFLIFYKDILIPEHKSICFTCEPVELLKKEGRKILNLCDVSYKSYKVYLRRFEDNQTTLLAVKNEKTLIEVTLDYFKLIK